MESAGLPKPCRSSKAGLERIFGVSFLVASLLLVAMPFVTSSFLFRVGMACNLIARASTLVASI